MDDPKDPRDLTEAEKIEQEVAKDAELFDEGDLDSNEPLEVNQQIEIPTDSLPEDEEDEDVIINNGNATIITNDKE